MTTMFDVDFVRASFPGLESEWVFFDNAGGSQIVREAVDKMSEYLYTSNVQHGASYAPAKLAAERVAQAVQALAAMINAESTQELIVGSSSTQLLSNLAQAMEARLQPGDEIIVTNADHESNIGPWERLKARGIEVRVWPVDPVTGIHTADELDTLVSERSRLLCITQTSNIFGVISPIKAISRRAHELGVDVCVDGVAYAPHRAVDVRDLGADYYVFSFYKVFGPHIALLYGRRDKLDALGNINHYFLAGQLPYKLQPGGINYELTYALLGVMHYLEELGRRSGARVTDSSQRQVARAFEAIADYEELLADRLLTYLRGRPDFRIIGPDSAAKECRVPTISFVVEGRSSQDIVQKLEAYSIGARFGHFYARRLIEHLGLDPADGVIRVSMAHYNTLEEVDRLVRALDQIVPAVVPDGA